MSSSDVKVERNAKKDVDWDTLVEHCKAEIKACQERIETLSKSLFFFEEQANAGVKFPLKK
jgi:hypothetical protein